MKAVENLPALEAFIPYAQQSIDSQDVDAAVEVLYSKHITRGPYVDRFEKALAEYCGAKYAVCFHSGTSALQAAYFAAEAEAGDLVYTTPNTFVGSVVGALLYEARIRCIDLDLASGNLSLERFNQELRKTEKRQKKIFCPVHFSGNPVEVSLIERREGENLIVIEDAAHALGASYRDGSKIGCCAFSEMTVLSFHPAKSITTGEGGAVTTNSEELAERLQLFRNNGIIRDISTAPFPGYYEVHAVTGNYNFTDLQAALGLSQLSKLDGFIEKRRRLASIYRKCLEGKKGISFFEPEYDAYSSHHLFVAQIDFEQFGRSRAEVMQSLKRRNIGTQVHYIPLYRVLKCGKVECSPDQMPSAEKYYSTCLTLPLYPGLEEEDVKGICGSLEAVLKLSRN